MEPAPKLAVAEMSRPVTARTALSHWHIWRARRSADVMPRQFKIFLRAANKQSSTDPDEKTIAVILTTLPKAVERTIGKPLTAGPAWLMFLPLDFGRFFAAIYSPLRKWMIFDYAYHRTPQGGMLKTGR